MNRREKLIASVIGPEMDKTKARMLDATIKPWSFGVPTR
jgi:hypothetical protein